jgi:hypothetical protein
MRGGGLASYDSEEREGREVRHTIQRQAADPSLLPGDYRRNEQLVNMLDVQFVHIDDHLIFLLFKVLLAEELLGLFR